MTRIYIATNPQAPVRSIANCSTGYVQRADLLVSHDGTTYYTALFTALENGPGHWRGMLTQPALDIDNVEISFADGEITLNEIAGEGDTTYVLDDAAAIGEEITRPIMQVFKVVRTYRGHYVIAQNLLTGKSQDFHDGTPLTPTSGFRVRGGDIVEHRAYAGHQYLVKGDPRDVRMQTVTFDSQPATVLVLENCRVTFADDLSTVAVVEE